jgi:hypothetical protein
MTFPNEGKGSSDDIEQFFLKLGQMTDVPPLPEEFHERLRETLKHIPSNPLGSSKDYEILRDLARAKAGIEALWHHPPTRIQELLEMNQKLYEALNESFSKLRGMENPLAEGKAGDPQQQTRSDINDRVIVSINTGEDFTMYYIDKDTLAAIEIEINEQNAKRLLEEKHKDE